MASLLSEYSADFQHVVETRKAKLLDYKRVTYGPSSYEGNSQTLTSRNLPN